MRTRKLLAGTLAAALAAVMAVGDVTGAQAQGSAPPGPAPALFAPLAGAAADAALPSNRPEVVRSRPVAVNTRALLDGAGRPASQAALPEINLNLFADASFVGKVRQATRDNWGAYWNGTLANVPNGYFYLTLVDGAFMAHVASPKGVYEVARTADGSYRTVQLDQSKLSDHGDAPPPPVVGQPVAAGSLGATADTGSTIDIMVAYTATARAAAGGTAGIKATILTALNETNTSYSNSGVVPRLRLVHVEEVSYTESGNTSTDVNRLKGTTDGYMDNLHTLRNTYGADMVGLIVENGGGYCGEAAAIMATASTAFQVTARSCATGNYSFGHEFGHLQGARHDTYVDSSTTPYAYGHGHVNTGSTTSTRWRTIMSYNDRCAALGYNCTRLQYWSNPTKTYSSAAMGVVGTSENYKVLNNTAYTVANFRTQVIGNNFASPFTTSATGWTPVYGTWAINTASGYYQTGGAANLSSSIAHANTFGDVTFEARMNRSGTCSTCANRIIVRGTPTVLDASKNWLPSYSFQYSNAGTYSVYARNGSGVITTVQAWTPSSAIVRNGWNTLKVVAVGSSLKFSINGVLVWSGTNSSLAVGKVGVGYFRDAAIGTLLVDYANAVSTPTADRMADVAVADAAPAPVLSGGSIDRSPRA
jgi:hypothetical protein